MVTEADYSEQDYPDLEPKMDLRLQEFKSEDNVWDVPVVVFCVWTVVLVISSLIVLSCLKRETKKFNKRLARADNKAGVVQDIKSLESIISRYVKSKLGLGVLATMANSFDRQPTQGLGDELRREAEQWFQLRLAELKSMNYNEKMITRTMLSAIRSGLMKHPLDIRGSRLALEAARIFLDLERKRSGPPAFLSNTLSLPRNAEKPGGQKGSGRCPTLACDWLAKNLLKFLSLLISHPSTTPLLFALLSFSVWLFDTLSDLVIIDKFWNFQIPILYPKNDSALSEITYLSYQTLTIDLYAPLLLLVLVFSLMFTLLSCSCSRMSDRYRTSADFARPEKEVVGRHEANTTTLLARYDFNISSAVTAPLPQFTLQFSAYIIILYMLETLKGLSVDQLTKEQIADKIADFSFVSLWLSGLGSGLALIVAQYSALKIQHEHCLTLSQRMIYFLACVFNTIAIMSACLMLVFVVLLPAATYVGRYHIMVIIILGAAMLGVGFLISAVLATCGLDATRIQADRIVSEYQPDCLLTAFLRFSQAGRGQWRTLLGGTTLIGRVFSLLTINLFLPPSQLLVHPFLRFYANSPRSPALHYAVAKQIVYYNILTILSSTILCVDITQYGFNYALTPETKNLLMYVNICGVPFLFLAHLLLFKFYSSYDLWTSNGVHLVYFQDSDSIQTQIEDNIEDVEEGLQEEMDENATTTTLILRTTEEEVTEITQNPDLPEKDSKPQAESTLLERERSNSNSEGDEQNESTEADRFQVIKKQSKVILKKQKARLNKRIQRSCLWDCVEEVSLVDTRGKWVDVSDIPLN